MPHLLDDLVLSVLAAPGILAVEGLGLPLADRAALDGHVHQPILLHEVLAELRRPLQAVPDFPLGPGPEFLGDALGKAVDQAFLDVLGSDQQLPAVPVHAAHEDVGVPPLGVLVPVVLVGDPVHAGAQVPLDLRHGGANDRSHVRDPVAVLRRNDQMEVPRIVGRVPCGGDRVPVHGVGAFGKSDHRILGIAVLVGVVMGRVAHQAANAANLMVGQLYHRALQGQPARPGRQTDAKARSPGMLQTARRHPGRRSRLAGHFRPDLVPVPDRPISCHGAHLLL